MLLFTLFHYFIIIYVFIKALDRAQLMPHILHALHCQITL